MNDERWGKGDVLGGDGEKLAGEEDDEERE